MIRDVKAGLDVLRANFTFRVRLKLPSQHGQTVTIETRGGGASRYFVNVLVNEECWAWLPDTVKDPACEIALYPVLFSLGINEWQILSNMVGGSSVQAEINALSLRALMSYANLCISQEAGEAVRRQLAGGGRATSSPTSRATQLAVQFLAELSEKDAKKDHGLLWTAADCSRLLGGGRVTFCKSGKVCA
jgi:hypothetical protein